MRTLREEIMKRADGPARSVGCDVPTITGEKGVHGTPYELTFRFGDDFLGFQGHFPGHPILPAFVQLLLGECAVRRRSDRPWILRRVERAKFLRPIQPNEPVTVCWQEQPQEGGLRCSFTLRVGSEKAAVFTLELAPEVTGHA
jgi:3-hydroxyacyl-[acyl-carrier-protein] dehydratase